MKKMSPLSAVGHWHWCYLQKARMIGGFSSHSPSTTSNKLPLPVMADKNVVSFAREFVTTMSTVQATGVKEEELQKDVAAKETAVAKMNEEHDTLFQQISELQLTAKDAVDEVDAGKKKKREADMQRLSAQFGHLCMDLENKRKELVRAKEDLQEVSAQLATLCSSDSVVGKLARIVDSWEDREIFKSPTQQAAASDTTTGNFFKFTLFEPKLTGQALVDHIKGSNLSLSDDLSRHNIALTFPPSVFDLFRSNCHQIPGLAPILAALTAKAKAPLSGSKAQFFFSASVILGADRIFIL
jgi:hypothetical protein